MKLQICAACAFALIACEFLLYATNVWVAPGQVFTVFWQNAMVFDTVFCVLAAFAAVALGVWHTVTLVAFLLLCETVLATVFRNGWLGDVFLASAVLTLLFLAIYERTRRELVALLLTLPLGYISWILSMLAAVPVLRECNRHAHWICSSVGVLSVALGVFSQIAIYRACRKWVGAARPSNRFSSGLFAR